MCVTNQENCVTVSFQFQTMSVTYQVNYHIKFSEYVCDISGKLYHCMIPFSDNVCDISGQLPCQRSRRRKKMGGKRTENNGGKSDNYDVASQSPNSNRLQRRCLCLFSYYGCVITQVLYHFIIPFSDNAHDFVFFLFPIGITIYFFGFLFCKACCRSVWMGGFLLIQIFRFSDNVCDISGVSKVAILYQSLVVSIETKKKVMWTRSKFDYENT